MWRYFVTSVPFFEGAHARGTPLATNTCDGDGAAVLDIPYKNKVRFVTTGDLHLREIRKGPLRLTGAGLASC